MIRHMLKIVWRRKRINALLMVEIFFSFLVVFAVSALGISLWNNYRQPLGFAYANVWNIRMDTKQEMYGSGEAFESGRKAQMETFVRLQRELEAMDDVLDVAASSNVPYDSSTWINTQDVDGRDVRMEYTEATDRFAEVLGLNVVSGRWFEDSDQAQPWIPVVINRRLARDLFGEREAVGENLPFQIQEKDARVVGVVSDYRKHGEFSAPADFLFRRVPVGDPTALAPRSFVIKVHAGADAVLEQRILTRLQALARDYTFEVRLLDEMRETYRRTNLAPLLAGGLVAAFLMVMVGLGLIGVLWQNVTQRTRELGLRRATGAHGGQIRRQILGELWILTTLGLGLGVVVLVQVPLLDLASFVPPGAFLAGVVVGCGLIYALATASGLYPSWLATRIQPAEALHYE